MANDVSAALARKLVVGQADAEDKPRPILRALRLALARAAIETIQLPLSVIGAKQTTKPSDALSQTLTDAWLLLAFTNKDGRTAAVCLDTSCVSAILQMQTIGEILSGSPPDRVFTDTDAAMVAPLIESVLTQVPNLVDAPADSDCFVGYEFLSRAEDVRSLSLALVDDEYRVFDLTVDLGGGVRQGQLSMFIPEQPAIAPEEEAAPAEAGPVLGMATGVMRAELNAVMCRLSLPLSDLSDLDVGNVLPLTGARLDRIDVLTIERKHAAVGRLGQCGGMRAIRVNEELGIPVIAGPDAPEFIESRTRQPQPDVREADQPEMTVLDPLDTSGLLPMDHNPLSSNPDEIAAEISQLAGLTGLQDDQDQKF